MRFIYWFNNWRDCGGFNFVREVGCWEFHGVCKCGGVGCCEVEYNGLFVSFLVNADDISVLIAGCHHFLEWSFSSLAHSNLLFVLPSFKLLLVSFLRLGSYAVDMLLKMGLGVYLMEGRWESWLHEGIQIDFGFTQHIGSLMHFDYLLLFPFPSIIQFNQLKIWKNSIKRSWRCIMNINWTG